MTDERHREIASALTAVQERLGRACVAAGRDPRDVQLLPVTKYFPVSDARILYDLGCREFGESRDQEASAKAADLTGLVAGERPGGVDDVHWHMIGSVQRKKARSIVRWATVVHSVDSEQLVDALSRAAAAALDAGERATPLQVLLQVSLDDDPKRGGVPLPELPALCEHAAAADGLEFAGLMAVPPLGADPDVAFATLAATHRDVLRDHPDARMLSAGMTADLESAVRHGSTCVRVGTALLGSRPLASE
ncbi:YggS family pyridoxal phosphate-dependent enzyme [Rhodococcus sp. Q]|uniref:YggS family pyridoxal phosphate-dependent enzyme n=1 Tax=Rhodococcus sp. Q TaxID=2502252 RepID=UPI0010F99D91|nr:YggS family pyridoxal phosphate-dependent enzyme [Rhodococcus sp. Q]